MLSENSGKCLDVNNVISIEYNNAESYSNKSNKPNNTSISTEKNVNFRQNRKKQKRKKDQIVTPIVADSMVKDNTKNNQKVVVKHLCGSTTEHTMTYDNI